MTDTLPRAPARMRRSDVNLLYAARCIRGIGDGFAVVILPAYLTVVGLTPAQIGFVAAASLLGTAVFTLAVGLIASRHDLRNMLALGAALMAVTGAALPSCDNPFWIAAVLFIGTINPSIGDIGVLVPLEHASLARGVLDTERTRTFARYSLIGALSMAAGSLAAGLSDALVRAGLAQVTAFRVMFYLYAALGIIAALLYLRLSRVRADLSGPAAPLGASRHVVYRLAALFSLDAFAGGFVVQSLLALWLFKKFELSVAAASVFFFWAGVLSAFSYPVAARIASRVGLVNTMVFTHIPSSLCLVAAAFSSDLTIALVLLLARSALSQMDVPTRTSYVMAVVTPAERTAAAGITAAPRSLASSISPAFSGVLLAMPFAGLPLVLCGSLKIIYDLALLYSFRHIKPPEEGA
ncbi:MAG TPA: MFS transporter [Xanthobacteraceae bacterium]|jgi:MFS family permease|nr:MFS transporter [Xanthobacteraceae bacterium]